MPTAPGSAGSHLGASRPGAPPCCPSVLHTQPQAGGDWGGGRKARHGNAGGPRWGCWARPPGAGAACLRSAFPRVRLRRLLPGDGGRGRGGWCRCHSRGRRRGGLVPSPAKADFRCVLSLGPSRRRFPPGPGPPRHGRNRNLRLQAPGRAEVAPSCTRPLACRAVPGAVGDAEGGEPRPALRAHGVVGSQDGQMVAGRGDE